MSQFYLTLPSNSSAEYYPENTLTHFVTKLHNDIELSGEWEAALVDIMYPRNWYTIIDQHLKIIYKDGAKIYEINVSIPSGYYRDVLELLETINAVLDAECRKPFIKWSTGSFEDAATNQRQPNAELKIDESLRLKFKYNERNREVVLIVPAFIIVRISKQLSRILGIESTKKFYNSEKAFKSSFMCDIEGGLHAMYVYCDVLECVPVGDTVAPLLRIVEIKGEKGETVHIQYEKPRYIPLGKKHFDSIELDIRDDIGQNIPFDSGKLIATIHFRKQKEAYFLG